ncbi:MAG: hypothetical protein H7Z37_08585, partial [Pyrinomonadaceae bacterium]|nr:hypothetical protein [Pyrinomonadaceae bacterium]
KSSDRLTVAVSYRAEGSEEYRILALNGIPQPDKKEQPSYQEVGGTSSTGEFVTVLASIFKPESQTKFETVDTDLLRGRRCIVYSFNIKRENSKQTISTKDVIEQSTISGSSGKIWIDRELDRVLRVESNATEIPTDFPVKAASRIIDYDWVIITDRKYLLPVNSDVRLTSRYDRQLYETRNQIAFRNYQKYGTDVRILDDDDEVVEETPVNVTKP